VTCLPPARLSAQPAPLLDDTAEELPRLGFVRARSLAEQVADAIVEGIARGALEPGQRLIEAEIAAELGVSRLPVREALKTLEIQGIVQLSPHRGARIAEVDQEKIGRVREVRAALEKIAVRDALPAYRSGGDALRRLDTIIARMEEHYARQDWSGLNKADIAFHREICRTSGNDVVITLWETLARHVRIVFGREVFGHGNPRAIVDEHYELRNALADPEARALDALIDRHIKGAVDATTRRARGR
jgi:DNA-binding GntR family transcriptional regulator